MGLPFLRLVDEGVLNLAETGPLRETGDAQIVRPRFWFGTGS